MKHYIRLTQVLRKGRKLTYQFESSLGLFKKHEFYILYDKDFPVADESILAVPFAAVMASISWMTGADLEMDVLDENYIESLKKAREFFYGWFSKKWSFAGKIKATPVKNTGNATREGVMYSGGLDSLSTYIRHKDKKPILFSFFGADIPLDQVQQVAACKRSFQEFAANEGLEICCIESDLHTLFKPKELNRLTGNWWGETAFAMVLSAVTAPYSYKELGNLRIASSHVAGTLHCGEGSDSALDNNLRWANTQLQNDFDDANRMQKIQFFKDHPKYHRYLRVCFTWQNLHLKGGEINCSRCEKCYRTMCELILNSINPADCNLLITNSTFNDMKKALERSHVYYSFFRGAPVALVFWKEIQSLSKSWNGLEYCGSADFFKWFAGYDRIQTLKRTPVGFVLFRLKVVLWWLKKRVFR